MALRLAFCSICGSLSEADGVARGAATEMEGVCRAPGVQGGLAMLSRLQEGPLARVLLTGIPAQGGFNAVYLGEFLLKTSSSALPCCGLAVQAWSLARIARPPIPSGKARLLGAAHGHPCSRGLQCRLLEPWLAPHLPCSDLAVNPCGAWQGQNAGCLQGEALSRLMFRGFPA